jgi:hypothetical protein
VLLLLLLLVLLLFFCRLVVNWVPSSASRLLASLYTIIYYGTRRFEAVTTHDLFNIMSCFQT